MAGKSAGGEELITEIKNVAGINLAVTENRNWLEVFFEGDLMHTRTVNLPPGRLFDITSRKFRTRRLSTSIRG